MLRLILYGLPATPIFEMGDELSKFHELIYFTIERVPEEHDSYFDDKILEVPFDTGDFTTGSESKHFVRDPASLRLDMELESATPSVPDSDFEDKLEPNELNYICNCYQAIVATQIPDRDLINWATHILFLDGDEQKIIDWFKLRRHCPTCEAVYHMEEKVPIVKHRCDRCGTDLVRKDEDDPKNIHKEFKKWRNSFWGFEEIAKKQNKFKKINMDKMRDFNDAVSRANLWIRNSIEKQNLDWYPFEP